MTKHALERRDLVLAALSSAGCSGFEPVHVQKLFFLIDRMLGDRLGGEYFDFQAYDYGPFDKDVYAELECLSRQGFVQITGIGSLRTYSLTPLGQSAGSAALGRLGDDLPEKVTTLANWVRTKPFTQLVSAIYKEFPDMAVNSVFSER
jgi:uncharacterized protein YwgA